jgi:hypothetical protein
MTNRDNDTVTYQRDEYLAHKDQIDLVNSVYDGIDTAVSFLNQLPNEHDDSFEVRVKECTLNNHVERVVAAMSGQVTRKDLSYSNVPDKIISAMEVISGQDNLNQFAKELVVSSIKDGKGLVLVDMPVEGGSPMFTNIRRGQLINWRKDESGLYTFAVIMEQYTVDSGSFGLEANIQYRVIDKDGNVDIWREASEGNEWEIVQSITTSYNFCPLFELDLGSIPPLYDIARVNIKHMNFVSIKDRFLKEAQDPILFAQNLGIEDGEKVVIGVNQMMTTDNPDSSLSWVELDGSNYDIAERNIISLEDEMADRALRVQEESRVKTATQVNEESAESTSRLSDIATELENCLQLSLNAYSLMKYSVPLEGNVVVNRDFDSVVIDTTALAGLNTMQVSGNLSRRTLLKAVSNSELVEIEDIETELKDIEAEAPEPTQKVVV